MYYVYVLKCSNGDLYIGYSDNLKRRFLSHISGRVRAAKSKRPVTLVYYEAYKNKQDATRREIQLKMHKVKSELKEQLEFSLGV